MASILYAEDDDDGAYMLSRRLRRSGHSVRVARDGAEAIRMALEDPPDLVLMDLGLPGIDGWEAARRLRSLALTARVPIIAVSSHAMSGERERALAAGCDDYDTKPIDYRGLLAKIEALLARSVTPGEAGTQDPLAADPACEHGGEHR